jgi:hypothetical protein
MVSWEIPLLPKIWVLLSQNVWHMVGKSADGQFNVIGRNGAVDFDHQL